MPCIVVWGGYLLAFWPALLGNDELGEWAAVLRSELTNSIPAFHALMLWLVTRAWRSPAAVVVVQIVACAAVFASVVTELGAWGLFTAASNGSPTTPICAHPSAARATAVRG